MLGTHRQRRLAQKHLDEALAGVDEDSALSPAQKLARQARLRKDWEVATGNSAYGYANRTPLMRVFGMSFLRSAGREIAKGVFGKR